MSCWWESRKLFVTIAAAVFALVGGGTLASRQALAFDEADQEQMSHGAGRAVAEGTERQQVSPEREGEMRAGRGHTALKAGDPIWLQTGKTRVLQLPNRVKRVSIGNPELAGVVVLGPRTIMLSAKQLPRAMAAAGQARGGTRALVTGRTLTPEPRFAETTFTVWYGAEAEPDVHTLFVADFVDQQVMLDVIIAEINRTAIEQHGIDFRAMKDTFLAAYFMGGGAGPAPSGGSSLIPSGGLGLPIGTTESLPVFAFESTRDGDVAALIEALQREGLATILAKPKILAMSGQNASFQSGGEIPIRIATGFATDIEFKPFGTIVNFVPRVSEEGDIILTVTPEVSQVDFSSLVEGIPSFRTRRASTATRLRNGQTRAIGGLMQTIHREEVGGVPYLKDIPFVGYVFRKTIYSDEVVELLVVVTPHLVEPLPPGTQLALPTERGPLTNKEIRTKPHPAEATRPRIPALP
jgi:Flp pilus assembly secretin CpaC